MLGRLPVGDPIAIVDIGSNSVRLVIYEGETRAPTPMFNEKVMCGLGKGVATTGRLNEESVAKALNALLRFRTLCRLTRVSELGVMATAAARDAANGGEFLLEAERALGAPVALISSHREAELAALGVISSFHRPDGVVGDLGGGSLELTEIAQAPQGGRIGDWTSLQIGGLALMDRSGKSLKKATKIVAEALSGANPLAHMRGRDFFAVGGTWRALAKLHMERANYPLHVMHGYAIPADEAFEFVRLIETADPHDMGDVSAARAPLLAYGAAVLEEIIRIGKPSRIVISAMGVREGLLYDRLAPLAKTQDGLIAAAQEWNCLRARDPRHAEDLNGWMDGFFATCGLPESENDARLRLAACLLSDVGWRAHPDYRGEQSLNMIAHANFICIDHGGRALLALASSLRHEGVNTAVSPAVRQLLDDRGIDRARLLAALMRVGYMLSAAIGGVLPETPIKCERGKIILSVPADLRALANDRVATRLKTLAKLAGMDWKLDVL